MQGESSRVGTAPHPPDGANLDLCCEQVLRLKQSTVIRQMALLRMAPARQLLHAPADHLIPMTLLKRSTLRRLLEQVRICLIKMLYEGLTQGLLTSQS